MIHPTRKTMRQKPWSGNVNLDHVMFIMPNLAIID